MFLHEALWGSPLHGGTVSVEVNGVAIPGPNLTNYAGHVFILTQVSDSTCNKVEQSSLLTPQMSVGDEVLVEASGRGMMNATHQAVLEGQDQAHITSFRLYMVEAYVFVRTW